MFCIYTTRLWVRNNLAGKDMVYRYLFIWSENSELCRQSSWRDEVKINDDLQTVQVPISTRRIVTSQVKKGKYKLYSSHQIKLRMSCHCALHVELGRYHTQATFHPSRPCSDSVKYPGALRTRSFSVCLSCLLQLEGGTVH